MRCSASVAVATELPRRPVLSMGFSLDANPPVNCGGNGGARAQGVRCPVPGVRGKRTAPPEWGDGSSMWHRRARRRLVPGWKVL